MFTPTTPSVYVLIGDQACDEAEHLISAMIDHVEKEYFPLIQVVCFPDAENNAVNITPTQISITSYPLRQLVNGGFASVVNSLRRAINEQIPNINAVNIRHRDMYIAFICKGTQTEAETVFRFRQEAQTYLEAMNCTLITQLCFLLEDDEPVHYKKQSDWLRDPQDTSKPKAGLLAFDRMLVLSASNNDCLHNYQTQLQMESVFPLALLSVKKVMEYTSKAYTMRYGKINGSTYDMRRLLKNAVVNTLERWASREVDSQDGWEMLSTRTVNIADISSDTESLTRVLSEALADDLPKPEDLALIGLSERDFSPEKLIFSFDEINGDHMFTEYHGQLWGEQWYSDVLCRMESNPQMEGLIGLLEDDGTIGKTIHNAYIEADERLHEISDVKAWLRKQWSVVDLSVGWGLPVLREKRNMKALEIYYPAYMRLCKMRGTYVRLSEMEKQRVRLISVMRERVMRRRNCLNPYRLPEYEHKVLCLLCDKYAEDLAELAGQQDPSQLNCYHAVYKELYHAQRLEENWLKLYKGMVDRMEQQRHALADFCEAFARGQSIGQLDRKIREHRYNDKILIPQVPMEMPDETHRTFYLMPQAVYDKLNLRKEDTDFVCIPGDVIERVSYVSLGNIENLLTLRIFSPIEIDQLQPISAINIPKNTRQTNIINSASAPASANPWNVRLIKGDVSWELCWQWMGSHNDITEISWNGEEPISLTHKQWVQNGEKALLNTEKIPFGRFDITLKCEEETTTVRLVGKPISLRMVFEKRRGQSIRTSDNIILKPISFHLEGRDLSVAWEKRLLLRKINDCITVDYDFFGSFSLDKASTLCTVYCEPGARITFEGRENMAGLVHVQEIRRDDAW